ncbi:hypothetical protein HZS61_006496 [Fusarium oxysporum f. sp. conglutinans]|uniref:Reverse transcriptase domain-containing protein n=1 Tax=Fusarium oxysporum f. sp. conglutinans TaxID=100902 RepID=A0A8H6GAT8_FUSOX|nr:hypothetical protein HZS61_006496 [Fusarium oxysporum f. sp. conglutinans]KAG6988693.1 Retrovirus-related Pol polyprotein from type-1 retrotransposable element R1 [Fusarium oxysporum f. sp. conglutinans]
MDNANQQSQCACHAEDGTNHSVEHVDCVKCEEMSTRLQVYQLNVRKNDKVHLSMMNDKELEDYVALAVAEPWACTIEGQVMTVPNHHSNWTKMIPTKTREPRVSRWPIRSMLWIRRDLEAEQVPIPSPDLTAAIVRFPERDVLVVSVYIEGRNEQALEAAMGQLHTAIAKFRNGSGRRTDVILVGDFNRHDTLWGGDEVTGRRQGEAGPIIELMGEHGLHSLLPRGTKTWEGPGGIASTIDLVLASTELADEMTSCGIHPTEHGSDHRAIRTEFDTTPPERTPSDRLLFKNAPWLEIKERVRTKLEALPCGGTVQAQTDRLMSVVLDAINDLVPRAKPSPYAKRWWTTDLTRLRRMYTYWRNQARACRRRGREAADLEQKAREAAKEYHDAIRRQKKAHWNSFLEDGANIWQSAKYLSPGGEAMGDKIPPLKRRDGTTTSDKAEQAEELLSVFFPPLPAVIEDEERRPAQREIAMPELTLEEVEEKVMAAKAWKAPGEDGLPAMVWKQLWPVVGDRVLHLFRTSLRDGELPVQWRSAKIIPLKKPGKDNYKVAKSWRPISLLSTLGKILEAVVADRISYAVETFGLLPTNHFGGRKQRSAEQALLLLQEHIYKAWRNRKVLSLISFDVKGAYNGVFKDRLLQRLEAKGIPKGLVKWIDAFCSNRSATIVVNGYTSGRRDLPQAGLPQGSPLSPVLFLFFNADLVQCKIDAKGGSIAFIDDYSAWVTGLTAEANRVGIQAVIDRALEWERRSGATFEEDKTVIIHFTRHHERTDESPYTIKGQAIIPKKSGKILGLVMDSELRYEEHVKEAATRGLRAAMCLRRLKMLTPRTARQLFVATVAPTMDYASNVWSHRRGVRETKWLNEAQKMGVQAITGAFKTVSMAVAEAEAGILPIGERHAQAGTRLYVNMQALPKTHPLATLRVRETRRYLSPLTKLALAHEGVIARMETIEPYALPPWHRHMVVKYDSDKEAAADVDTGDNVTETSSMRQVLIATSASARNGLVGMGGVVRNTASGGVNDDVIAKYSVTLGLRDEQNAYMAELEAIAMVLRCMPDGLRHREVIIATRNRSALQAIAKPRQQSGQGTIREIYKHVERLEKGGNTIEMRWVSSTDESFTLRAKAKAEARKATDSGCRVTNPPKQVRSTRLRVLLTQRRQRMMLPEGVGGYSKRLDKALPGKHTRTLYDALKRRESAILVQLRTGMARVNRYLHRIGAAETDTCDCGQEEETVEHFLFRCPRWDEQREHMRNVDREMIGNLSFFLGGKTAEDGHRWSPNLGAVRAVIKFAISTGRLDATQT